jgi:LysR family glycine cleavage system transcriptional activator
MGIMARRLPNLKQLRAFEAAARHLSFKDAADELNVTHAAVSHQIKALEEALGINLFHRRTRRVELTPAAEPYAAALTAAFDRIAGATAELGTDRMEGEIRISCAPFYGNRLILPRLARFHQNYPGLRILPEMDSTVVDFGKSDLDAGVRYGAGNWPGLGQILLHDDVLVPVAAPELLEGRDPPFDAAEIAAMTLGYVSGQETRWTRWFQVAGYEGPPPELLLQYGNRARVVDLAFSGHGVALADRRLISEDLAAGRLIQLNPLSIESTDAMYVVFPKGPQPDPRVVTFAEWLREEILAIPA